MEKLHRENPVLALHWPCTGLQCSQKYFIQTREKVKFITIWFLSSTNLKFNFGCQPINNFKFDNCLNLKTFEVDYCWKSDSWVRHVQLYIQPIWYLRFEIHHSLHQIISFSYLTLYTKNQNIGLQNDWCVFITLACKIKSNEG